MSKKSFQIKYLYFLSSLIFLTGFLLLVWFGYGYIINGKFGGSVIDTNNKPTEQTCDFVRVLDGLCVKTENEVNPEVIAIMIENHSDARPQSGLAEASIVYEAPVEANYTRFLAIYPADLKINKIGPVRSARPYYLDWLSEYGNAVYMHVGGSPVALDLIKQFKLNDWNEFYNGQYYWRSADRLAPHNVYTSSDLWNKAIVSGEILNNKYNSFKFATTTGEVKNIVTNITVSFLPPVYEAVWKFNSSTNNYERYQMNKLHLDQTGKKIVADNVIVQMVIAKVLDEIGRQEISTIGKGNLYVFKNGEIIKGEWRKVDRTSRTRFFDEAGVEIKLNPGKTWVEVISNYNKLDYK